MGAGPRREGSAARHVTAQATRSAQESHRRTPGLDALGLAPQQAVHWNLRPAALYEHAARRGEGVITEGGAFCAVTSPHTGRSPNDKFIVRDVVSESDVWWGRVNHPMTDQHFERLRADVVRHLNGQELFVRDLFAGADPNHRIGIRFVTPNAWHALFVYNMFLRPTSSDLVGFALSFGLSGTGKTTLSADPERALIGDDEHGWSDQGVFNVEGGCYAKVIRLSREGEPEIYATTRMFGTVLENVVVDPETRAIDLESAAITENTRASYPIHFIPKHVPGGMAGHPSHIVLLTCDAYGIMPPIARLSPAQAMYHFLSGYTAKVAGTERGVTEPNAAFSACFGAPFLPLHPSTYAALLGEKIARHGVQGWLVNTGWSGGPYGVGQRMRLGLTRAMVRAALAGKLDRIPTTAEPVFGLEVPLHVPGVPEDVLLPRATWRDPAAYDAQATQLALMFRQNFEQFQDQVHAAGREAGPSR